MDMVLYSMFKNKIANAPLSQVDNVGGIEIRFVDALPENREDNTLYFVLGTYKNGDKIDVGGKGIEKIVFENTIIDYGILNGNVFLNKFDYNRDITRVHMVSNNGDSITVENTVNVPILDFTITGQNNISYVNSVTVGDVTIDINDYFIGAINGADTLDMTTGEYTKYSVTGVINENLKWRYANKYSYGTEGKYYREYFINGYYEKPEFINYNGNYDTELCKPLDVNNAIIIPTDSDFIISSKSTSDRNCIFSYGNSIYLRIEEDKLLKEDNTYMSISEFLKNKPITFSVCRNNPKVETKLSVHNIQPIMALEGQTTISINCRDEAKPILEVKLPIKE